MRSVLTAVAVLASTPAFAQVDLTGFGRPGATRISRGCSQATTRGFQSTTKRGHADAFMLSYLALPERCIIHESLRGPRTAKPSDHLRDRFGPRAASSREDDVVDRNPRAIWMDGREHPSPLARHTAAGFSTGTWQGEALLVTTTHLTEGVLTQRRAFKH